jgi:hypothetical protein
MVRLRTASYHWRTALKRGKKSWPHVSTPDWNTAVWSWKSAPTQNILAKMYINYTNFLVSLTLWPKTKIFMKIYVAQPLSRCLVLAVMSWPSCPLCPARVDLSGRLVQIDLSQLSPGCAVQAVLSRLSARAFLPPALLSPLPCLCCHALAALSSLPRPGWPVTVDLSGCPVQLICPSVQSQKSYPDRSVIFILMP